MRKHFSIASFSAVSAPARHGRPAPHLTHHLSRFTHRCLAPFLFRTNKPRKINILPRAPLKTKEKQFSIQYKFAYLGTATPRCALAVFAHDSLSLCSEQFEARRQI
jgi:hypothetical protein